TVPRSTTTAASRTGALGPPRPRIGTRVRVAADRLLAPRGRRAAAARPRPDPAQARQRRPAGAGEDARAERAGRAGGVDFACADAGDADRDAGAPVSDAD